ncbi:MAG TPA: hypothetical protein VHO84_09545 [Syntrophorhabdaceae bacterium]|nr:hypothetical protein [Syntrophorhabdaceae bacterium]
MNRIPKIGAVALAILVTTTLLNCKKESEEDTIRRLVSTIQTAAEEKDTSKVMGYIADSYSDPQGTTHETLKRLLRGYFLIHPKISVYISYLQVSVKGASATANLQALLTSGQNKGSLTDVIPHSLGVYQFDVSLAKESDNWKIVSATWTPVELNGESNGGE